MKVLINIISNTQIAEIQETYQEWNRKKALETLLKERGVLKEMNINFVPKEEVKL